MNIYKLGLLAFLIISFAACEPQLDETSELGALPTPSFEVLLGDTPNEFTFVNTSENTFMTQWDLGSADLGTVEGDEASVTYPFMGEYIVTMTVFGQGGSASASKVITVTQDDPNACSGNELLLTGCGTKTWKLANEANALHVGPNLTDSWWGNSNTDLVTRSCHFDDEYIFTSGGVYEYDNKGDFWADDDGGGNIFPSDLGLEVGCNSNSDWPSQYQSWGSNTHAYNITASTLTITGLGAWIGLYKVGTDSEVDTPQQSVVYNISEISATRMVIYTDYGGLAWRFTLVAE